MWKCKSCSESLEDNFDSCWNCGHARDGSLPEISELNEAVSNKKIALLLKKTTIDQKPKEASAPQKKQEVVVVDVNIPIWSMVKFMLKWTVASIPAFIIILIVTLPLIYVFDRVFK